MQAAACQAVMSKMANYKEGGVPHEAAQKYLDAYGVAVTDAAFRMGCISTSSGRTVVQTFLPKEYSAAVLLVHGYFDHSVSWRHIVPQLTKSGYGVILFDLPGHGLSGCARAEIGSFSEYRELLAEMIDFATELSSGLPVHLVAHSTGAGVTADLLMHLPDAGGKLGKVVLVAPLLRSSYWAASGIGVAVSGVFKKEVKRSFRVNSSDPAFKQFQMRDPLQHGMLPLSWPKAQRKWHEMMVESHATSGKRILFVQGDLDDVVAWDFNIPFYMKRFPKGKVEMMPGARHQIMNESLETRQYFIKLLLEYLQDNITK